jgi:hypothetical protein
MPGRETDNTSAPKSARIIVASPAAGPRLRSSIRSPVNGVVIRVRSLACSNHEYVITCSARNGL